jgi:hypothetical protein
VDERRRLRQLAENERLLREANEEIEREAREDQPGRGTRRAETELEFFCTCGRADCDATLLLTLTQYEAAQAEPDRFIVAPGHVNPDIERVVEAHETYLVVAKAPALATNEDEAL